MRPFAIFMTLAMMATASTASTEWLGAQEVSPPESVLELAVEPGDYPGHDYVSLLDDGALRIEADGRYDYTLRQVAQVVTRDGADSWGDLDFSYYPERQEFRLNWLRVVGLDGTVLSEGPEHRQETSPTADRRSPVYSDRRIIQMTVASVAPGTIVDFSYTVSTTEPRLPGDQWTRWNLNSLSPVRWSRFTVDAPEGASLSIQEENVPSEPSTHTSDGRLIRQWEARDLPAIELQSYAAFPNDVVMSVKVAGDLTWDQIGTWYAGFVGDRYSVTDELRTAHAAQLQDARSWEDSLRATYRWVAQDFRYVSLSLGDGAYRPRPPEEVFTSGFGDCKDKAVMFVALARDIGFDASPVLVSLDGDVDTLAPSMKQFDHMIAAVQHDGETLYFDLTTELTPYGEIPASLQGSAGLLVVDDTRSEVVQIPRSDPELNRWERSVVGTIGRDNRFVGSVTLTAEGTEQYALRDYFSGFAALDDDDRMERLNGFVRSTTWVSASADSSQIFEGRDLTQPARATVWFSVEGLLGSAAADYTLSLPLMIFAEPGAAAELDAEGERLFPIDIEAVNSPSVYASTFEVELPESWRAVLPADASVEGPFGYYTADYRQVGSRLSMHREMGGLYGTLPPDSIGALRDWLTEVSQDNLESVVLQRGSGLGLMVSDSEVQPGRLPDMLNSVDDLPSGAALAAEGTALDDQFLSFTGSQPLEAFSRTFAAEQMVFTVGGSSILYLVVSGATYRSAAEARKDLRFMELIDVPLLMEAGMQQMAPDASVGDSRAVDLAGIGDDGAGWVMEMVTPVATMELGLITVARGRVSFSIMVVGVQGMADEDLTSILRVVDERVAEDEEYSTDLDASAFVATEVEPIALTDSVGIALEDARLLPGDFADAQFGEAAFVRDGVTSNYSSTIEGFAFTFRTGEGAAMSATTEIWVHRDAAHAAKAFAAAQHQDVEAFFIEVMDDDVFPAASLLGDESELVRADPDGWPVPVLARRAALRGGMRTDIDDVRFVHDRYVVSVSMSRLPGESLLDDVVRAAELVQGRLSALVPDAEPPSAELLESVRELVVAELAVDSLVDARSFDEVFEIVDGTTVSESPASFDPGTWNSICWWASLYDYAEQATAACEAAVEPDPENLGRLDSRALNRALTGDVEGAIADFSYIVENSGPGPFLDRRNRWLSALLDGENPFTEQVLEALRDEG